MDTASVFVVWPAESFAWRLWSTRATLVDSLARLFKNGSKDVPILGNGEQAPLRSELWDSEFGRATWSNHSKRFSIVSALLF